MKKTNLNKFIAGLFLFLAVLAPLSANAVTGIKAWSTTPGNNNASPPNGAPEGMAPNTVNDIMRQMMTEIRSWYETAEWVDYGHPGLTYVAATQFRVTGDQTAVYTVNRRVRAIGTTPFTIYGIITASTYSSPNTTVTATWDSGSLDSSLTQIAVGSQITNSPISAYSLFYPTGSIPYTALSGAPSPVSPIPVGAVVAYPFSDVPTGWLQVSNLTIGDASSNATADANPETQALFIKLWTQYDNTRLPMVNSSGTPTARGGSAAADYAAHDALPLLDYRGRVLAGYDSMGGTSANRLTAATAQGVNGDTIGATGGEEAHVQTLAELVPHTHTYQPFSGTGTGGPPGGGSSSASTNTGSTGSGAAFNILQPTVITPFIIKL